MRTAVLGMGSMGRMVAGRLLAGGHQVTVWNRTPGRADALVAAGAAQASSPLQAVAGADAVLLSLADDGAVRELVLGPGGLAGGWAEAAAADAVLVDTSTVAPGTSRALAEALGAGRMVAAPIIGGPAAVEGGTATYLLAGDPAALERLEPVWEALSSARVVVGTDPGAATTVKVLSNGLLLSGLAALSEVVAVGQALGLDDAMLRGWLGDGPLVAAALRNRLDDVLAGDHQGWFSGVLGAKDARLATELAATAGLEVPVAVAVRRRFEELAASDLGPADIAAVVELTRRSARS